MPLLLDLPNQTLVDPRPDSFATRTPCTWKYSSTVRRRGFPASRVQFSALSPVSSTRSAISVPQEMRREFSVITTQKNQRFTSGDADGFWDARSFSVASKKNATSGHRKKIFNRAFGRRTHTLPACIYSAQPSRDFQTRLFCVESSLSCLILPCQSACCFRQSLG